MRIAVLFFFCLFSSLSFSQNYPVKPIRIVVGYPPGGSIASESGAKVE